MADENNPYPHNAEALRRMAQPPTPTQEEADMARDPDHVRRRKLAAEASATYKNRAIDSEQPAPVPQQNKESSPPPPAPPEDISHRRTRAARSTIASDEKKDD